MTRAGRPPASVSWLLVVTGVSCTYHIGLPGVAGDAETGGVQSSDASIDQSSTNGRPWSYGRDECHLKVEQNRVEIIVALDRSTSMQKSAFDSTTRLQAAQAALMESIRAHPLIQFGLELFPSSSSRDCNGATCCAGGVSIQPASDRATSIANQMACGTGDAGCAIVGSDSPSHQALSKCREWFSIEGLGSSSRFVLLVTDRDPTCAGDASTDATLCSQAVEDAGKLTKFGVQVYVVSLSGAQSTDCLAGIAAANPASPAGKSRFAAATDQQDLKGKLEAVMKEVELNLCRFSLAKTPDNPDQVVVSVDHEQVTRDPSGQQGGWRFSDSNSSEIVVSGSYCTALVSGQGDTTPWVQYCGP